MYESLAIMSRPPFPFGCVVPVNNLVEARSFYVDLLGSSEDHSGPDWVVFNLYDQQIVAHLTPAETCSRPANAAVVAILTTQQWSALVEKLRAADVRFLAGPYIHCTGEPVEEAKMLLRDPTGNAVELKAFVDIDMLFSRCAVV